MSFLTIMSGLTLVGCIINALIDKQSRLAYLTASLGWFLAFVQSMGF